MVWTPLYEGTFEYAAAERSAYNKRFVISVVIANMQRTCNTQTAPEVTPQQPPLIFANEIVPENVFAGVCAPSSAFGASSLWELHLRQLVNRATPVKSRRYRLAIRLAHLLLSFTHIKKATAPIQFGEHVAEIEEQFL